MWAASQVAKFAPFKSFRLTGLPWLMVSLNDGEDPHFRKAEFDAAACPENCPRPCESICPAGAIAFNRSGDRFSGVVDSLCYGCGRCLDVCPIQQISTRSYVSTPAAIAPLVLSGVDAVEIHTQVGRLADFERLWRAIAPSLDQLKLVAISCPDGEDLVDYLWALYDLISPLPCSLIWQTDGRPMSGDIGNGTTRATVKLGQKVLAAALPGYVQLAGGTNSHTVPKLVSQGLLKDRTALVGEYEVETRRVADSSGTQVGQVRKEALSTANVQPHDGAATRSPQQISGIAYGSYARTLLASVLDQLAQRSIGDSSVSINFSGDSFSRFYRSDASDILTSCASRLDAIHLETHPDLLWQAVSLASSLVSQIKSPMKLTQTVSRQLE